MEKQRRVGQTTDDNMVQAHCMLDAYGYKYTHRICNTYCFSNTKMVARTRLSVTYIVCLVYKTENIDGRITRKATA